MRATRRSARASTGRGSASIEDQPPGKLPGYNTPWDFDDPGKSVCPKTNDLWKPVIAAVNGMACGGAFYILGEVDFIIASDRATFFDPHVTYGMPAAFEPIFLLHKMPFQEVMRLSLLGAHERMSAERAREIGFVSEVVPAEELEERTRWAAQAIADQPERAIGGTVRALWMGLELSRRQALDHAFLITHVGTDPATLAEGQARVHLRKADRLAPALRRRRSGAVVGSRGDIPAARYKASTTSMLATASAAVVGNGRSDPTASRKARIWKV